MYKPLEFLVRPRDDGDGWDLLSPGVGLFANPPEAGIQLNPGDCAGMLIVLDRPHPLHLPEGVIGWVDGEPSESRHLPVEYSQVLLRIHRNSDQSAIAVSNDDATTGAAEFTLHSPQAGRFYRRPDPNSSNYCEPGEEIKIGRTIGLLEVMKTFNPVKYQAGGQLPDAVTIKSFMAEDGADVAEGQPLVEFEESD
jgi:biotin carboxyl carrier protein